MKAPAVVNNLVAVVVPCHTEELLQQWVSAWKYCFDNFDTLVRVIIIADGDLNCSAKRYDSGSECFKGGFPGGVSVIYRDQIEDSLRGNAWIIPQRSSACRSYGFWFAWKIGARYIMTMDSDITPIEAAGERSWVSKHISRLCESKSRAWWVHPKYTVPFRGLPYYNLCREWLPGVNVGLWKGCLDVDAVTQLVRGSGRVGKGVFSLDDKTDLNWTVPVGSYFPMCGMNLAFQRDLAPAMYFGLQGQGWPYDRFDDIWCGVIVKKICDHLGYAFNTGSPVVGHDRASDVWESLRKEVLGLEENERFWERVDSNVLTGVTVAECMREMAARVRNLSFFSKDYRGKLFEAMLIWQSLFQQEETG